MYLNELGVVRIRNVIRKPEKHVKRRKGVLFPKTSLKGTNILINIKIHLCLSLWLISIITLGSVEKTVGCISESFKCSHHECTIKTPVVGYSLVLLFLHERVKTQIIRCS